MFPRLPSINGPQGVAKNFDIDLMVIGNRAKKVQYSIFLVLISFNLHYVERKNLQMLVISL